MTVGLPDVKGVITALKTDHMRFRNLHIAYLSIQGLYIRVSQYQYNISDLVFCYTEQSELRNVGNGDDSKWRDTEIHCRKQARRKVR